MATSTYSQSTATNISNTQASLLRRVLYGNVIFSAVSSILFLLASASVAEFLGITNVSIFGLLDGVRFISFLGIGIALFGMDVLYVATRPMIDTRFAWIIAIADFIWVILSWILLATGVIPFSDMGNWAVLIVSDIVLVFALGEVVGIRRINR